MAIPALVGHSFLALAVAVGMARPAAGLSAPYDARRAANVASELFARATGASAANSPVATPTASLKSDLLTTVSAPRVPTDITTEGRARVFELVDALEARDPTRAPATRGRRALDGRWRVRWSDAPPPSNGMLGPLPGEGYQIVDVDAGTYVNELVALGGALSVALEASFEPRGDEALRVKFLNIRATLFGSLRSPAFKFPEGTERTWLLTYTDDDLRLVRAGVDGGRSTARDLGFIPADEGESADAYLFVLTRDTGEQTRPRGNALGNALDRAALKRQLLELCEGQARAHSACMIPLRIHGPTACGAGARRGDGWTAPLGDLGDDGETRRAQPNAESGRLGEA